jgi:rhodanese-related sulfurtransferase
MKFLFGILVLLSLQGLAQKVSNLPAGEFEDSIDNTETQLLDVRREDEFKSGHIEGAFLADWTNKKQFLSRVQYLDKAKPVYIYCLSGGRSAAAATWLAENGFTTVVNLEGGIIAWKKEGKKIEADAPVQQMTVSDYEALLHASSLVLINFGAEWCLPCKKMEPVTEALGKAYKDLRMIKIDAGIHSDIMKKQNIEEIPVFILYKDGKEVWRKTGVTRKEDFEKALQAAR